MLRKLVVVKNLVEIKEATDAHQEEGNVNPVSGEEHDQSAGAPPYQRRRRDQLAHRSALSLSSVAALSSVAGLA